MMTDNELLLQISDLLDVKLQATENRLREEIRQVRTDLQGEIQQVRSDLQGEIQQVKANLEQVQITLENDVIPRLQNIEECYTSTYDRYRAEAEKVIALEADVNILKKVVREHSEKLKQIG